MRLFTALDLASEHKRLLSSLRRPLAGVTWYPPESYHLTLRFIGDIRARPMMEEIDHALAGITAEPFDLTPCGVGLTPQAARTRLWAGVAPSPSLTTLQSRVESVLRRCGVGVEKRRFVPHIALGIGPDEPGADIIRWMQQNNLMRGKALSVEHFTLFRSHRTADEPHYEACADYPLGAHALPRNEAW